jgi:hypothetical protein
MEAKKRRNTIQASLQRMGFFPVANWMEPMMSWNTLPASGRELCGGRGTGRAWIHTAAPRLSGDSGRSPIGAERAASGQWEGDRRGRWRPWSPPRCCGEGLFARSHLMQDKAKKELIRTIVDILAESLLRAHVAGGAKHLARRGDVVVAGRRGGGFDQVLLLAGCRSRNTRQPEGPGEAEIEDFHSAIFRQHNVLRLEIAMDEARGVRGRQAIGDLGGDVDESAHGEWPASQQRTQRSAIDDFATDVLLSVLNAKIVYAHDIGMIQRADGARLTFKPGAELGAGNAFFVKHFDGDIAVEARVPSAVRFAHAAYAQRRFDLATPEARINGQWHAGVGPRFTDSSYS